MAIDNPSKDGGEASTLEAAVQHLAVCAAQLGRIADFAGEISAKQDFLIEQQALMADAIGGLSKAQEESTALAKSLQEKAARAVEAHEAEVAQYRESLELGAPVDPFPFESIPAGTAVRDLPDGGRLFTFADGHIVRVSPDGTLVAIGPMGEASALPVAKNRVVTLPTGMELTLQRSAVVATHAAAGVFGIPLDVEPVAVAPNRYRFDLDGDLRLEVDHAERRVLLIDPTGSVMLLGARIEGIGEKVDVRFAAGGARGFTAEDTGHAGMIEADGTIHLVLATGRDLVIRFQAPVDPSEGGRAPRLFM